MCQLEASSRGVAVRHTHAHTCTAKPSDRPKELLLRNLLLVF